MDVSFNTLCICISPGNLSLDMLCVQSSQGSQLSSPGMTARPGYGSPFAPTPFSPATHGTAMNALAREATSAAKINDLEEENDLLAAQVCCGVWCTGV